MDSHNGYNPFPLSTCESMTPKCLKAKARMKFADAKFRKDFLELCLREVNKEGFSGSSLKNVSWNRMIQELKLKYNKEFNQKQLKNQWDYLRRCYTAWRVLVKGANNGYNAETGTFDWPDHVWDDVIQKYPDTRKYRYKPLEERELLKALFEDSIATGEEDFSPTHPLPPENPRPLRQIKVDEAGVFGDEEPLEPQGHFTGCNFYGVLSNPTLEQGEKSDAGSSCYLGRRRKRECFEDPLVKRVHDLIDLVKGDHVEKEKVLDDCLAKMKELMTLGVLETDLYMAALKAFCDNLEYRKLFLKIETDELKVLFLKTITKRA